MERQARGAFGGWQLRASDQGFAMQPHHLPSLPPLPCCPHRHGLGVWFTHGPLRPLSEDVPVALPATCSAETAQGARGTAPYNSMIFMIAGTWKRLRSRLPLGQSPRSRTCPLGHNKADGPQRCRSCLTGRGKVCGDTGQNTCSARSGNCAEYMWQPGKQAAITNNVPWMGFPCSPPRTSFLLLLRALDPRHAGLAIGSPQLGTPGCPKGQHGLDGTMLRRLSAALSVAFGDSQ